MANKKAQEKEQRIITTDGTFFEDMRAAERRILKELGDEEALKILDEEEAEADKE